MTRGAKPQCQTQGLLKRPTANVGSKRSLRTFSLPRIKVNHSLEAILAQHPDLVDELRAFFKDHDRIGSLAGRSARGTCRQRRRGDNLCRF